MDKINEQIQWYEQNSTSYYDDLVRIELKKIKDLCDAYEDHSEAMFVDEMIEAFCKIIQEQRKKIQDLEAEGDFAADSFSNPSLFAAKGSTPFAQHFMTAIPQDRNASHNGDFGNEKQLQEAFTAYCLNKGRSSYTANDYCSRIKNLWKTFYAECQSGELPEEMTANEENVQPNSPLLNAYHHTAELHCYVSMQVATSSGNRNWLNTRAAFNQLDRFKMDVKK